MILYSFYYSPCLPSHIYSIKTWHGQPCLLAWTVDPMRWEMIDDDARYSSYWDIHEWIIKCLNSLHYTFRYLRWIEQIELATCIRRILMLEHCGFGRTSSWLWSFCSTCIPITVMASKQVNWWPIFLGLILRNCIIVSGHAYRFTTSGYFARKRTL